MYFCYTDWWELNHRVKAEESLDLLQDKDGESAGCARGRLLLVTQQSYYVAACKYQSNVRTMHLQQFSGSKGLRGTRTRFVRHTRLRDGGE